MVDGATNAPKTTATTLSDFGGGVESDTPAEPKYRDKEWLREQYVERELSQAEIADMCECSSRKPIRDRLEKYDINTRPPGGRSNVDDRLKSEQWLEKKYCDEKMSMRDIGRVCGHSDHAVYKWLNRHGIDTRDNHKVADERLKDESWLRKRYVGEGESTYDIADELGVNSCTVLKWIKRAGIKTRPHAPTGPANQSWNGGPQPYGPGWTPSKRRTVRERDGHTCQDPACSVTQDNHLDRYDEKLHVHHLIKARDLDDPEERNAAENLITLCRDCHQRWERMAETGLRPQVEGLADC